MGNQQKFGKRESSDRREKAGRAKAALLFLVSEEILLKLPITQKHSVRDAYSFFVRNSKNCQNTLVT